MKLILIGALLYSPTIILGSDVFYNSETHQCETETGDSRKLNYSISECGRFVDSKASKLERSLKYRRESGGSMNLKGIRILNSNLDGIDLSGFDLEGAVFLNVSMRGAKLIGTNFKNASFDNVHLASANLSDANLSGATFANSTLEESVLEKAKVTEATKIPLGFDFLEAQKITWSGIAPSHSHKNEVKRVELPPDMREKYPGAIALTTPDSIIFVPSQNASFKPMSTELKDDSELGMHRGDYFDILCAARFKSCRRSKEGVSSMYAISHLPQPILETGLEFYHGDTEEDEVARFVALSTLEFIPVDLESQTAALKKAVEGQPIANLPIVIQSPLQIATNVQVRFNFLPQPQQETRCFLKDAGGSKALKCKVIAEFNEKDVADEQWLKQKIQGWVRSAPHSTANVELRLPEVYQQAVFGEAESDAVLTVMVPMRGINFWQVVWGHYYAKPNF